MSASLLKKSLKLIEEDNEIKKKNFKKSRKQQSKREKILANYKKSHEKPSEKDLADKLKELEKWKSEISIQISEKVFARTVKSHIKSAENTKAEETTVFSEEDFEAFEKEYFVR